MTEQNNKSENNLQKNREVSVWGGIGEKKSNKGTQWYLQNRIFDSEGLSPALSTFSKGYWIIVYGNKKDNIEKFFTPIGEGKYVTTTSDGNFLSVHTTRPRRPLWKKLTNYVLEIGESMDKENNNKTNDAQNKEVHLLNGTVEGYIGSIDANYHKGISPSDVKRNARKRTHIIEDSCDYKSPVKINNNDFRIRKLTPRECERLQAFPDDWTRWGKDGEEISDTQRYKCIGNAVTTTVITYLVDEMFSDLDED